MRREQNNIRTYDAWKEESNQNIPSIANGKSRMKIWSVKTEEIRQEYEDEPREIFRAEVDYPGRKLVRIANRDDKESHAGNERGVAVCFGVVSCFVFKYKHHSLNKC